MSRDPVRVRASAGASLGAGTPGPAPPAETGPYTPDELQELERIETSLRFLKLTRPRTEEYLTQKAQEDAQLRALRRRVLHDLSSRPELLRLPDIADEVERRKLVVRAIESLIEEALAFQKIGLTVSQRKRLVQDLVDDVLGLGPIEQLVRDDEISEIMVNGPRQVFVERQGKLTLTPVQFDDENHLRRIIDRIVSPLGRRIDESSPIVDARLADGSRVNALVTPIAIDGASLTIRKFRSSSLAIADLIALDALTPDMALFLEAAVRSHLNVVISGGTGSGKTTLLNALAGFIPHGERIVTIEDAAELQVKQHHEHVVRLESRPPNIEGRGAVTIRDLVRASLRMRPDRIVVGECRGGEALDMLQAMNTGHDGSMTTGHANTPRDMVRRLETMVKMSGIDLPILAIREQIASAVHVIVQASRLSDGSRKVTAITTTGGLDAETEQVRLNEVFVFEQTGVTEDGRVIGRHRPTGHRPSCLAKFRAEGHPLDDRVFEDARPRDAAPRAWVTVFVDTPELFSLGLQGTLTQEQAATLRKGLGLRARNGPPILQVSLGGLEALDTSLLACLVETERAFTRHGRRLVFLDVPARFEGVLAEARSAAAA